MLSALRCLHEPAFVQFDFRAADHQLLHKKCVAEPENCTDVVVLGTAFENDRDRPAWLGKKLVTEYIPILSKADSLGIPKSPAT